MRTTQILALSLALTNLAPAGCASSPGVQPAPRPARDGKTPIAAENPTISQRNMEQRIQEARIAQGQFEVEGQFTR